MSQDIKQFLMDGNQQFIERRLQNHPKLIKPQTVDNLPMCAVVGCADSRTCAEHIFSQSLGNFYSVRNAGHYVTEEVVASLEFAITSGIRNIMIYGHTQCGAIQAALQQVVSPQKDLAPSLKNLLERFIPTIRQVMQETKLQGDELLLACVEKNIHKTKNDILERSAIIRDKLKKKEVTVLSGIYDIQTGLVRFFE